MPLLAFCFLAISAILKRLLIKSNSNFKSFLRVTCSQLLKTAIPFASSWSIYCHGWLSTLDGKQLLLIALVISYNH
jgi:predicted DNA-binding ribbon-helix-helix protein